MTQPLQGSEAELADGRWAHLNVPSFFYRAARRHQERPFLIWPGGQCSYGQMLAAVERAAQGWRGLGVDRGDRVAFLVADKPSFIWAWFGLAAVGGVIVALNPSLSGAELTAILEHVEPTAILTDAADGAEITRVARSTGSFPVVGVGAPDGVLPPLVEGGLPHCLGVAAPATGFVDAGISGDELVSIIYTSGSTGQPKGVMQTHQNYVLTGEAFANWLGLGADDRLFLCLPLFHINAQAYTIMGAIAAGASIVAVPTFSVTQFWSDVRRYRVTAFNFIGAMFAYITRREPEPEERDHFIRVAYGVPALADRQQLEARFGFHIICGYGMSEATFGLIEAIEGERRDGSMGKPRCHPDSGFYCEARVVDERGREVPDGEVGELLLRNPALMAGYFQDPEATAARIRGGWLHTGDMVWRDEDGFYYFVDRRAGIIRRRGENVSSHEVEEALKRCTEVAAATVVGVPSEFYDEEILAVVVPEPGVALEPAVVLERCRSILASFKLPRYLQIVEQLPQTETHKVDVPAVRRQVASAGSWFDRDQGGVVAIPEWIRVKLGTATMRAAPQR